MREKITILIYENVRNYLLLIFFFFYAAFLIYRHKVTISVIKKNLLKKDKNIFNVKKIKSSRQKLFSIYFALSIKKSLISYKKMLNIKPKFFIGMWLGNSFFQNCEIVI